ncbi:MAG TPA: Ig domain-containing protein [Candidatus Limnocylindrales bacterium]|nr:Ig domain-containing protein [Candidatus Limnocylindrales bacterium]
MRGRFVVVAAVVLAAAACSPVCGGSARLSGSTPVAVAPSPTPTTLLQGSSPPFHVGEVGVAYATVLLTGTGGVAPYTWSVNSGALPTGLVLGQDGAVSGVPTTPGSFAFTIRLADAGDSTASIPGTITIGPALALSLLPACADYCYVELGCDSTCGGFGQQSGGVAPYMYTLLEGPLPAGTSLAGLSLTGTFTGLTGWLQFKVQVSDAAGGTAVLAPKFWILQHLSLLGGTCTYSQQGLPCNTTLQYLGGHGNVTLKVEGWSGGNCGGAGTAPAPCPMPPIGGSGSNGLLNVTIGRVPANSYPFPSGTFTVSIQDQALCSAGVNCSSAGVALSLVFR